MKNKIKETNRTYDWIYNLSNTHFEKLFNSFINDPNSVDISVKNFFKNKKLKFQTILSNKLNKIKKNNKKTTEIQSVKATNNLNQEISILKYYYRKNGHKYASINPLKNYEKISSSKNNLRNLNIYDENTKQNYFSKNFFSEKDLIKLKKIIFKLKKIYCGNIGFEYMHIDKSEEKEWIQKKIESKKGDYSKSINSRIKILKHLVEAETLEKYLSSKFPGSKRFSLEGAESLIPLLKETINCSFKKKITHIILGMAHRGRLNVLVNILGKNINNLIKQFSNKFIFKKGSGDVKYHMGYSSYIKKEKEIINILLSYNPSHLEIVNPVISGITRAYIDYNSEKIKNKALPISIHGDASFVGQGVIQETLNMSQTRGYKIGGTLHIIINNQIGFTTSNYKDARSTKYCTDIAKMINSPIFHVNADDPEAIIFVTKLAIEFREKFKKDIFIDLFCYRRHGHNEADDPSVTQPIMYKKIKKHKTVCNIFSNLLKKMNNITEKQITEIQNRYRKNLIDNNVIKNKIDKSNFANNNFMYKNLDLEKDIYSKIIDKNFLKKILNKISKIPCDFKIHDRVNKIYKDRYCMSTEKKLLDWGAAENLAYAILVYFGIKCRLSGQDIKRGTFFHRHSVIYDQKNGLNYIPLYEIDKNKRNFFIFNSVLSEESVLAFEYGYSTINIQGLNIWEAQFGDFVNGAQVVIDQFITSGEEKWGIKSSLIMLLPHGYDGQGPEHSSGRIERFLQLCSNNNIKICIPSSPSQIYHLLINQVFCKIKKPLIIFSPKSLLRHQSAKSDLNDLIQEKFKLIIDEIDNLDFKKIKKIIFCYGKVYYDLLYMRRTFKKNYICIIRIEQLYPFPKKEIKNILKKYSLIKNFVWCQEEPKNQGGWYYIYNNFKKLLFDINLLSYEGRQSSPSTAAGHAYIHKKEQIRFLKVALDIN
ncbi:2-oxoglutarate dehydrogenase E1 component [Buchnera aphidicola (Neophyllaphis varicolor)]|uniref:2-oxoglutarate dehydrogenase E1 component n=1 Tax=Buchnera aphidicola TaxID=9 RepID=UPI0031B80DA3